MKNMERDLKALVKQFHAASEKKEVAMSKLEKLNPSFLTDDLALLWLLRSLDLRVHFLDRCINDDQETTGKSFDFALEALLQSQDPAGKKLSWTRWQLAPRKLWRMESRISTRANLLQPHSSLLSSRPGCPSRKGTLSWMNRSAWEKR